MRANDDLTAAQAAEQIMGLLKSNKTFTALPDSAKREEESPGVEDTTVDELYAGDV